MVATSESAAKTRTLIGKKVSKPLMEKKRRARINQCLDQLKSLLENYYANNIRKRKLEKADILELTVKHLRNLQKIKNGSSPNSDFDDFKAGFRSCLAGVNQYLLMTDSTSGSSGLNMLSHLSNNLPRSEGQAQRFSTKDSGSTQFMASEDSMGLLFPATEAGIKANQTPATGPLLWCFRTTKPHFPKTKHPCPSKSNQTSQKPPSLGIKTEALTPSSAAKISKNSPMFPRNVCHSVEKYRNEVTATLLENVWRPW